MNQTLQIGEVPGRNQKKARQKLAALDSAAAKCSFDFLASPPTTRIAQSPYFVRDFLGFDYTLL